MRVTSNTFPTSVQRQIQTNTQRMVDLQTRLSSQQRITLPEDDPSAFSRVMQNQGERRELIQYRRNLTWAETTNQLSQQALGQVRKVLDQVLDFTATPVGIGDTEQIQLYAIQADQMLEEALSAANSSLNGDFLFAGTASDNPPFEATRDPTTGDITAITYVGNTDDREFDVAGGTRLNPRLESSYNADIETALNNLLALRDAYRTPDLDQANVELDNLTNADNQLLVASTDLLGKQVRLGVAKENDDARYNQLEEAMSREVDIDVAQTAIELNQAQLSYQAVLQSAGKVLQMSLLDYI